MGGGGVVGGGGEEWEVVGRKGRWEVGRGGGRGRGSGR